MRSALLLLLCVGCARDPSLFGPWNIRTLERDGVSQDDAGFLDVQRSGTASTLLRYTWTGDGFEPDPSPAVIFLEHDASPPEAFDAYHKKGETYSLELSGFEAVFDVIDYDLDRMTLKTKEAMWPQDETSAALPTKLVLRR